MERVTNAFDTPLSVYFHSNRPISNGTGKGDIVSVQGWQPYSLQESLRRFKRIDGASHPYHAKFGVAQSAKYDWFLAAPKRHEPPYMLADTDTLYQCTGAEIRRRFKTMRSQLVIGISAC